jgi:hypothetical protein
MNYQQQVFDILVQSGFDPKSGSENISIPCPLAPYTPLHKSSKDRKPSMGIKVINGSVLVHCFTCGFKSRQLSYLYSRLTKSDARWGSALEHVRRIESEYVVEGINALKDCGFIKPEKVAELPLDEGLFEPYSRKFAPYLHKRGITLETGKRWGVGMDQERKRVLIPIRDIQGHLWGGVGRSYVNENPKYLNYWNMKKGQHLLGAHLIKNACTTIVVEGSIDALVCDQFIHEAGLSDDYNTISILGSSISKIQAQKLVSCSHEIILALDADSAGIKGMERSSELLSRRLITKRAFISSVGKKDFGSCTSEEIKYVLDNATI